LPWAIIRLIQRAGPHMFGCTGDQSGWRVRHGAVVTPASCAPAQQPAWVWRPASAASSPPAYL
jgi:hypothetical protein